MSLLETYRTIAVNLETREVVFPTSVQVALRLKKMLDDPDCHIEQAAKLVSAEPLLASKVVAVANSVVYNRSGREIADVRMAVSRLGFNTLRTLTMTQVAQQLAHGNQQGAHPLADQLWTHTAHVASLAHALARHVTHVDPETAMFAGIVHEIGGFYLLSQLPGDVSLSQEDLTEWMETGSTLVGNAMVKKLGLPANISEALGAYWEGFLAMPPTSLADTLLLAEALAPVHSPLSDEDSNTSDDTAAQIEMLIGSETLNQILQESEEEIGSLIQALQA